MSEVAVRPVELDVPTPAELRRRAAQAMRIAQDMTNDGDEARLLALADELLARADQLERSGLEPA